MTFSTVNLPIPLILQYLLSGQVSNDVRMLLPVLVGILAAKWVADAATHSLYHSLLAVKCVPWLPANPSSTKRCSAFLRLKAIAPPSAMSLVHFTVWCLAAALLNQLERRNSNSSLVAAWTWCP